MLQLRMLKNIIVQNLFAYFYNLRLLCQFLVWLGMKSYIYIYIYIYNTYSTSQSTIWENILRARKIFSRAKGE